MKLSAADLAYYRYCLETNPTNNRYNGAGARRAAGPLGWTIARSRRVYVDTSCGIIGRHRGPSRLRHYTDRQGSQYSQYLCDAHAGRMWLSGRAQDHTYPQYRFTAGGRRKVEEEPADA